MRFNGSGNWSQVETEHITYNVIRKFKAVYGDTITLVFTDNTCLSFNVDDIVNRHNNGLDKLLPENGYLTIAERALDIFIRSGRSLVYMSHKAVALEKDCLDEKIIMIFVEFDIILKKKMSKVAGDMGLYLKKSPLPKRIDFRDNYSKGKRRFKRYIMPVFTIEEETKWNGLSISADSVISEPTVEDAGQIIDSDHVEGTAEIVNKIEAIEASSEFTNDEESDNSENAKQDSND